MADSSQEGSSQSRNPSPARDRSSDGESDGIRSQQPWPLRGPGALDRVAPGGR